MAVALTPQTVADRVIEEIHVSYICENMVRHGISDTPIITPLMWGLPPCLPLSLVG